MIDKLAPRKQENNSYPALNDKIVMLENENKIIPILKKNISSLKEMNETIPKWHEKIEYLQIEKIEFLADRGKKISSSHSENKIIPKLKENETISTLKDRTWLLQTENTANRELLSLKC